MTESEGRGAWVRWAELAGFWALAIAKPTFDQIASGPEALTQFGIGRLDLLIVIAIVVLLPPTLLLAVEWVAGRISAKSVPVLHGLMLALMLGVFAWQQTLGEIASPAIRALIPMAAIVLFFAAYLRLELIRNFALFMVMAVPVVIVSFTLEKPVKTELFAKEPTAEVRAGKDAGAAIVMVVMDELSVAHLENARGEIDPQLYPNLAKLAGESTWYPNARSVAGFTTFVLPSLVTGEMPKPEEGRAPSASQYPDNLCGQLRKAGYEIESSESITNFCGSTDPVSERVARLLELGTGGQNTPGRVFEKSVRAVLPEAAPGVDPYDGDPGGKLERSVADLEPAPGTFTFLHTLSPHYPWQYLPDGQRYPLTTGDESLKDAWAVLAQNPDGIGPTGIEGPLHYHSENEAQLDSARQRYALQIAFVDAQLGRLFDRMKESGVWDEAMVLVTADHGTAFGKGLSRRYLTLDNAGELLAVPLFVKYPGQAKGEVVRHQVSLLDVAPTILDVADVTSDHASEGRSLKEGGTDAEPIEAIDGYAYQRIELPGKMVDHQADAARRRDARLFGSGTFFATAGNAGLLGKKAGSLPKLKQLEMTIASPEDYENVDPDGAELPANIRATVTGIGKAPRSDRVAVAVNGTIRAITRSWVSSDDGLQRQISVVVPADSFKAGRNEVEAFHIG